MVSRLVAYVVVWDERQGRKEVLTVEIGENESSKYWLGVLNRLKNRGGQDTLILCSDELNSLKEAVSNSLSGNGTSALYRTHGTQYPKVCDA